MISMAIALPETSSGHPRLGPTKWAFEPPYAPLSMPERW